MLRRVPGRVQERERQVADRKRLAVADLMVVVTARPAPGPVMTARADRGELARAGDEVGVHVRLDRGDDASRRLLRAAAT